MRRRLSGPSLSSNRSPRLFGTMNDQKPAEWQSCGRPRRHAAGRARFYSDAGYASMEDASATQLIWENALKKCLGSEEVVLWTDHRLTDQLILLKVLDWLSRNRPRLPLLV